MLPPAEKSHEPANKPPAPGGLSPGAPAATMSSRDDAENLSDRGRSLWKSMHALLIGINDYPEFAKLKGAVSDVDGMKEFLVALGVIDDDVHIRVLKNAAATRDNIVAAIERLATDPNINKGDPILIFYAGHGSTLPKPPNWDATGSEIQCLVPYDARLNVSGKIAEGVVPDATIASLLHKLADAKGDNITVILDCCHSGSGTRPGAQERGVEFKDEIGNRVTVGEDYDKEIREQFIKVAGRGAILDGKFLHHGLRSHVVLAACASKERAGEHALGLFTSALLRVLKQKGDLIHSLTYVELIKSIGAINDSQHPQCEGHYNRRVLFNPQAIPRNRLTFDVEEREGQILLYGGEMLGIDPGTEFSVHSSLETSLRDPPIGLVAAEGVVAAATVTVRVTNGQISSAFQPGVTLVAVQTSTSKGKFYIRVSDGAIDCVKTALALDSSAAYAARGWPEIDIASDSSHQTMLIVESDLENGSISFWYPESSTIYSLGLPRLDLSVLRASENLAFRATRVRDILHAGTHFFKYLQCKPKAAKNSFFHEPQIQAHLYEVVEGKRFQLLENRIVRPLEKKNRVKLDSTLKGYKMRAASGDIPLDDRNLTHYGIEIVNTLRYDLFVWVFFFDCSTLAIQPYYQPRVTAHGSSVDASVPSSKQSDQPERVPLNFGSGGGVPLAFRLRPRQSQDVGFLRIFVSTSYSDLSSIAQESPLVGYEERVKEEKAPAGARGDITGYKHNSLVDFDSDFWNVITLPLIQRVDWDQTATSIS